MVTRQTLKAAAGIKPLGVCSSSRRQQKAAEQKTAAARASEPVQAKHRRCACAVMRARLQAGVFPPSPDRDPKWHLQQGATTDKSGSTAVFEDTNFSAVQNHQLLPCNGGKPPEYARLPIFLKMGRLVLSLWDSRLCRLLWLGRGWPAAAAGRPAGVGTGGTGEGQQSSTCEGSARQGGEMLLLVGTLAGQVCICPVGE
jgi:hypothetical protein